MLRIRKDLSAALAVLVAWSASAVVAHAQPTFEDAIPRIEARFEPATAKPGDMVTWKVTMDIAKGWHTFPTVQVDPNAKDMVNKFVFPTMTDLVFEGDLKEPAFLEKADPDIDATRLRYLEGKVTWERKARIKQQAAPGVREVPVNMEVRACDKNTCLVPKPVPTSAKLTIVQPR